MIVTLLQVLVLRILTTQKTNPTTAGIVNALV